MTLDIIKTTLAPLTCLMRRGIVLLVICLTTPLLTVAYNVRLNVPFKAQLPPGTSWKLTKNCGQTSTYMAASFYNGTIPTEQGIKDIDDWLLQRFGDPLHNYNGSYTDVSKLAVLAKEYLGFTDSSSHTNWTIDDLKQELNQGYPVIVAVWTNMNTGLNADGTKNVQHFMLLTGMDDNTVLVNDPGHTFGKDNQYDITQFEKAWGSQKNAVVVIHPNRVNQSPVAGFTMEADGQSRIEGQTLNLTVPTGGVINVNFTGARSSDPDGSVVSWEWTINGARVPNPTFTGRDWVFGLGKGTHVVSLVVTDNNGTRSQAVQGNIVISSPTPTPESCAQIASRLVSMWRGEGNGKDSLAVNDGTLENGISFAPGEVGQALSLDGVDDYVNIPNSTFLDAITHAVTIEGWINPKTPTSPPLGGVGAGRAAIFARRDPNVRESFELDIRADGTISVVVGTTNTSTSVFVSTNPVIQFDGQWRHVAITADTATGVAKAYVNGQEVPLSIEFGPATFSGQFNNVHNLFIGRRQDISDAGEGVAGAAYFKGLIDEVSLYNRALTDSEVQSIFNAGSAGKCNSGILTEILPYQAGNYRYLVINPNDTPPAGYEQPGFNDSAWNVGTAPFGFSNNECPLTKSAVTPWPSNTHLLVRRTVSLPAGANNIRVLIAVDNDIVDVLFNGVRISTPQIHDGCPNLNDFQFVVPPSAVLSGDNVIVYHVSDRGDETFFDTRAIGYNP